MRKRSRAIISIVIVTLVIVFYYQFSVIKRIVDINTSLVTLLGVLLTLLLFWILLPIKKDDKRKTLENQINTVLSPISGLCLGRDQELLKLEKDFEHRNVLLIKGIAGIGKTTLGLKFKDKLEEGEYQTFWHQFNSESYESLLLELSDYLKERGSILAVQMKDQEIVPKERLRIAVQELCNYPTTLFLDNFQVFEDDSDFRVFKDYLRNSHLVIMSRELPTFLSEGYESLSYLDKNSSINLLRTLEVKGSQKVLEKIYEKTKGHPWFLVRFSELSRILPIRNLLEELPDFEKEQQTYISEQCWQYMSESERDFLMRSSAFTKPLNFDALKVCSKTGLSEVLISLANSFYIMKRGDNYYIHDIIRDFAFLKLKENKKLYTEAQREAADYYQKSLSAENLLLIYHHLKEAGDHTEAINSIVYSIGYFWREGFWLDVKGVLEESLVSSKDEKTIADIYYDLGTIVYNLGEWDKAMEYYEKSLEIKEELGDLQGIAITYGNLGLVYDSKGQGDKAMEYYKKDLEISEKLGDVQGIAQTYNNLGLVYDSKGEWNKAIEYYEKSLEIIEKLGDICDIARTYSNLGLVYDKKGEWDKAIEYYEKSLEISEKLKDLHSISRTYGNLGMVYDSEGEWDKAIEYYEKSLEISEKLKDPQGIARTYNNLGLVYDSKGEWEKAIEYYEKSLEISEKLKDLHSISGTYGNLGMVYDKKGQWGKAMKHYEKSLEISEKLKDPQGIAQTYGNLGMAYYSEGEWDKAMKYIKKDLEISEKLKDPQGIAQTYNNLGLVYDRKGEWDKAIEYYEKSLEFKEKLGDVQGIAQTYNNLGMAYYSKDEWDKAVEHYEKSLEISEKLGYKLNLKIVYFNLALCYEDMNQEEKAKEYYQKSEELEKQLGIENP